MYKVLELPSVENNMIGDDKNAGAKLLIVIIAQPRWPANQSRGAQWRRGHVHHPGFSCNTFCNYLQIAVSALRLINRSSLNSILDRL
jgi:hypothetical protein